MSDSSKQSPYAWTVHCKIVDLRYWIKVAYFSLSKLQRKKDIARMPPQQPPQRNEIFDWYNSIPPITKALFTLSIATTTVSGLGLISPSSLILYWPAVKNKLQVRPLHKHRRNRYSIELTSKIVFK